MKITKLLLTCTAIAGISAAFAVAANAEPITNNTYDKTAGTVSVASDLKGYAGDQMTVIVIPESAYTSNSIADADILYIDQEAAKADSNIFQGMGLKGGTTLPDGNYYIKVGGTNIAADGIIVEKITVSSGVAYRYGDVNASGGYPDADDAMEIINYVLWNPSALDNVDSEPWRQKIANISADRETSDAIDADDAMEIINYVLWNPSTLDELITD